MTEALLYAMALDEGLTAEPLAAPWPVLSRQVPRSVVLLLNGERDRGLRFFPWLTTNGGTRSFANIHQQLEPSLLLNLHGQTPVPRFVVDGRFGCERGRYWMRVRIHDGNSGEARLDQVVPFDPREPWLAVGRITFELTGVLGWSGPLPRGPALDALAMARWLVARDAVLAFEAGLVVKPTAALDALRDLAAAAPRAAAAQRVVLELGARLASIESARPSLAEAVDRVCCQLAHDPPAAETVEFVYGAAALLEACGRADLALPRWEQVVLAEPQRSVAAGRVACLRSERGEFEAARTVLRRAATAGTPPTGLLAQLAELEAQLGGTIEHGQLMEALRGRPDARPAVVRLVAAYLLDRERGAEAADLLEQALRRCATDAGLWLDRGRALLAIGRTGAAVIALESCLRRDETGDLAREARRLLRLANVPDSLTTIAAVDAAARAGNLRPALQQARALVRRAATLPEAWLLLGICQQRLDHARRAERALRKALTLAPDLGEAHNRLGILLVGRGRHAAGHEHLLRAVQLLPAEPSVHLHLAQACHYLGRRDEGLAALEQARRLGGQGSTVEAVRQSFFDAKGT